MAISSILDLPWSHAYWTEGPEFVAAAPAIGGGLRVGWMSLERGGDPQITLWPDEVSTADASTAAGTTGQPWYSPSSATFNNLPVVYIPTPDNNDRRLTATFASSLAQPFDVVVIGRLTDTNGRAFFDSSSANRVRIFGGTSGGADVTAEWRIDFGVDPVGLQGTLADTSIHLFRGRATTTDSLFIDETENISGDAGSNGLDGFTLLNTATASRPFNGEIAFVGVAKPLLSAQNIIDLSAWANSHYGTTDGATAGSGPYGAHTAAKFWVKADAITGKSDGDAISQWDDQSGNALHATQATGSKQPIYKTAILNGKPVVRFTAASLQVLATSAPATTATDNWTMVLVVDPTTNSVNSCAPMCNGTGSTNGYAIATRGNSGAFKAYLRGGVAWHVSGTASDTNPGVWVLQRKSGTTTLYMDGVSILTTTSAPTAPTTKLTLGNHDPADAFLNGDIGEAAVWDVALSVADLNRVGSGIASRWGTTWTDIP